MPFRILLSHMLQDRYSIGKFKQIMLARICFGMNVIEYVCSHKNIDVYVKIVWDFHKEMSGDATKVFLDFVYSNVIL